MVELGGPVRAGGLGIVVAAEIVIAARSVTFQLTEVRLGLTAAAISLSVIPRFTDRAAADLFLTARKIDADQAARVGLITRSVPDADLTDEIAHTVADLCKAYPQGLRESKMLLNRDLIARIDEFGDEVAAKSAELFGSDQAREAMNVFLSANK